MSTFIKEMNQGLNVSKSSITTLNKKAYDILVDIQNRNHSTPDLYLEITKAIQKVFNSIYIIDSDNKSASVKVVYANPERSVAKQVQEDNIILPILSFDQGISSSDQKRGRNNSILIHDIIWNEKEQRANRTLSLYPSPVNIMYKIHIWAKYAEDLDQILEQISLMFNPSLVLPNKFYESTKVFLMDEINDTDYPYKDGFDRVLRRTIELQTETYLPSPKVLVTSTGKIERTPHLEIDITTL